MEYIFFSFENFSIGGAASNRHLALIRSIIKKGINTKLLSCKYKCENLEFSYSSVRNTNIRIIQTFHSIFFILYWFFKLLMPNKKLNIVYLGHRGFYLFILLILCKIKGYTLIHERTELPSLMVGNNLIIKLDYRIYLFLLKNVDILFVITFKLKKFFSSYIDSNRIYLLNMYVDFNRFTSIPIPNDRNTLPITFCGDLSSSKDNVDILLKSFVFLLEKYPKCKLQLIGNNNNKYFKDNLLPIIMDSNIEDKVIFTGQLDSDKIPIKLSMSSLLVLSRDNTLQAQYGFPTKLGEYLASKTPVLITLTGEIGLYIDERSALIAEAGSIDSFSKKLLQAYDNYEQTEILGLNGYKLAFDNFNVDIESSKFIKISKGI